VFLVGTELIRIYVWLSVSLAVTSRCESWEETKELAEAFRFAATVTETTDIYGFTIASRLVGKEITGQREKNSRSR
jgi:hypothetical protein